jgi:hypothetical protein
MLLSREYLSYIRCSGNNCLSSRCLGIAHIRLCCIPFSTQRPLAVFVSAGTCPIVSRGVAMGLGSDNPAFKQHATLLLLLYFLISLWEDIWTNTQGNKLQSVKPCVQVWHAFSSIRKEEIVLTCLRIRHNCLTHMHLLQLAPTQYSTQCGMPNTILHPKGVPKFWQMPNLYMPREHCMTSYDMTDMDLLMISGWPCQCNSLCSVFLFKTTV